MLKVVSRYGVGFTIPDFARSVIDAVLGVVRVKSDSREPRAVVAGRRVAAAEGRVLPLIAIEGGATMSPSTSVPTSSSATGALMEMIFGFQPSRALCVAAELDIAEHLRDDAKTVDELARLTKTEGPLLYRLLRALAGIGVFAEEADGRFAMTALAEPLLRDAPGGSVHGYALLAGQAFAQRPWEELLPTLRGGPTPFERIYGKPLFEYLADHPEASAVFNHAMTSNTSREADAVAAAYDFADTGTIVDVAGGQGALLATILRDNPRTRGVLVELPHVVSDARAALQAGELGDRCTVIEGDMFASLPAGGNAYLLKRVIHDWDDDQARVILENCRRAMAPGGRVLIIDQVIPAGNDPHPGKFYDLMMLLLLGGRERREDEFKQLVASAGLKLTTVVPTKSPVSIVEAEEA
jgi:SAM-dependent methyltransferase